MPVQDENDRALIVAKVAWRVLDVILKANDTVSCLSSRNRILSPKVPQEQTRGVSNVNGSKRQFYPEFGVALERPCTAKQS